MANIHYENFIDFFKKYNLYDEEMFNYLRNHSITFDYRDEDYHPFIGCFPILDDTNTLIKIKLIVPFNESDIANLVSIHEYMHGIELYQYLGKQINYEKYKKYSEMMPILMERLYYLDHPSEELKSYIEYLDKQIENNEDENYKFALSKTNELIEKYNETKDIKKVQKKAKKLVRKQ